MARLLLALALLAGCTSIAPAASACVMPEADSEWLEGALAKWHLAEREWLALEPAPLPQVVAIDGECSYTVFDGDIGTAETLAHDGEAVTLGDMELPVGPISFADGSGRFVMSLPSVWRAAGVTSELGLETLMEGVLLHEIMHTRQSALATPALDAIEAQHGGEITDDTVQSVFESDPEYVAIYERERDLLFAAGDARTLEEGRHLAAEAFALMQQRRSRWFIDKYAHFAEMEDIFLTMEGAGQYMMYRHFSGQPGVTEEQARQETTRARWWTQAEGLALFLALDRLLPDWRERAFRESDWRAIDLLAAAVEG